jgi:predicted O-methyltransferase YrrM
VKVEAWRRNVDEAGLTEWAELRDGDALELLPRIDAEKDDYEELFRLARGKIEPGGVFVVDNVLSHPGPLAEYSAARQADPSLVSVTVPLDRGLELSVVLRWRPTSLSCGLPRKGGGPAVISDSTGSGGTSG